MMNDPLIITCAVVGAELTRKDTPHLPLTPTQIANSAAGAVKAGASIIHLHVRDKKGAPTQQLDIFKNVTQKIRKKCKCIIQYSTGGAVGTPLEDRCAPLTLKPDMASLSMGTMNFGPDIFENSENTIRTIAHEIKKYKILPELEIFDLGMMDTVKRYLRKKYIPSKFHVNFVLGVPGGLSGDVKNLLILKDRLTSGQTWTVSGVGRYQHPLAMLAIAAGGHVRIGFEDNIYLRKGERATTNAQFVRQIVKIAKEVNRPIATVQQARKILGI